MSEKSKSSRPNALAASPDGREFVVTGAFQQEADFGVVGDYRQVLPAMIEKLKTLLA